MSTAGYSEHHEDANKAEILNLYSTNANGSHYNHRASKLASATHHRLSLNLTTIMAGSPASRSLPEPLRNILSCFKKPAVSRLKGEKRRQYTGFLIWKKWNDCPINRTSCQRINVTNRIITAISLGRFWHQWLQWCAWGRECGRHVTAQSPDITAQF
jgi:hypothetical protein